MIRPYLLPVVLWPLLLCGQAPEPRGGYADLSAHLHALSNSGTNADRDSASAGIKRALGAILSSDTAFTATFQGVPISHVDAPDGNFRLFTWNVAHMDGSFRYEGYLLVAGKKGPELHGLQDRTDQIKNPYSAQLGPGNWYGAVYYEVIPVKQGHRTYYTLLGWKGLSSVETRKVIEVLDLGKGQPRFGVPLFPDGRHRRQREIYAFSAQSSMLLRWEPARKAIVMDHLSATQAEFAGQPAFMAPDLSYDSYTWDRDHWRYDRDIDVRGNDRGRPYKAPPPEGK